MTTNKLLRLELSITHAICEEIDTPRSLTVSLLSAAGEFDQLLSLETQPNHYDNHHQFADDYLVTSLLQKNPRLPTSYDKAGRALEKFYAAEEACRQANERISLMNESRDIPDKDILRALHGARENIRSWLGPLTRADLRFTEEKMRFGPGATTSLKGVVTKGKKYSRRTIDVTSRLLSFRAHPSFPSGWRDGAPDVRVRDFSRLTTVPKNAKIDRVICIEPDLNIFAQLGIGALIREKLRVAGLDLSSQQNNQLKAAHASRRGLCTMDLSSASDTICREAVWSLLPERWAHLLWLARVDATEVNGEVVHLQKWSSMGNGYTFELETLLFAGIVTSVLDSLSLPRDVAVYGDDLIFPLEAMELVERTLNFLGFSVNREKTFGKGRFHESCGTDWFDGINVRPFYLRAKHHDIDTVCYIYANAIRRYSRHRNGGDSCDSRFLPAWLRCYHAVKPRDRHLIPEGFGDVGFIENFDRAVPSVTFHNRGRGWAGYRFKYRSVRAVEAVISTSGALVATLNSELSDSSGGHEHLRGRFSAPHTQFGYALAWPNLGSWF